MTDELDWALAAKYLAGELSAKERADFNAWLSEKPDRAAQMSSLSKAFGSSTMPAVDVGRAWSTVSERMDARPPGIGSRTASRELAPRPRIMSFSRPQKKRAVYWALPALAAAALAAFLVPSIRSAIFSHPVSGPELRTIATATGERRSVVLAQGIGVILGPSTSLELEPEIAGKRIVRLNGEAYFTVTHDQGRRLYVRTASALIEDIGTAFDVRALAGAARTDVAVVEGVVALRSAQGRASDTVLNVSAGSTGTVEGTAAPKLAPGVRSDDALAWTKGQLAFHHAPLSEVALELNRWYGLRVSISDPSLATRTLSARFAGESPETVLNVIARTLGISYELEDQRVTFHSRPK